MSLIISRTPFRASFFGGGTDYPAWYLREGGAVLSTAIDKYCYITARYLPPFFPTSHRIVWRHIEDVSSIAEILHPAVREGLRMMGYSDERGVEIHHQGDLPARTGIGTSSAFAVGLIAALNALKDAPPLSRTEIFKMAILLEQDWLRDAVGSQDQVASAIGGFNRIDFAPSGEITVTPVRASQQRLDALQRNLVLLYTSSSRLSSTITKDLVANLDRRADVLREMRAMVDAAQAVVEGDGDLDEFGRMLDHAWRLKRSLSLGISTPLIDDAYKAARMNGALGGKLLGGGGTGFMLFYVPHERQEGFLAAMSPLLHVPFRFEPNGVVLLKNGDL